MKRGQVSIFIIIGVIVIGIIAFYFVSTGKANIFVGEKTETNPTAFLYSCIDNKIRESINILSSQGGYISNPLNKTFKFNEEEGFKDISYLCYTQNNYLPCVNQKPLLMRHLKKEIKNYISEDMESCFNSLKMSFEKQNFDVDMKYNGFEVKLMPKKVIIETDSELTLSKTGESSTKENFKIILPSRFYELAEVVQEIVAQEGEYCNFEYLGYMALHPEFNIEKFNAGDLISIYTVGYKNTKEKFRFAVKSCVIPPGF